MTATLLFLGLFLLGLLLALRPLLGPKEAFPEPPNRAELLAELEGLKEEVQALEGEEKRLALARMVELERALEGWRPPKPLKLQPLALGLVLGLVALVGVGLWRYTLPRLPGETLTTQRAEAQALRALEEKARRTQAVEDLLAWGRRAWEVQAFDQAGEAYLEVLKKDPKNLEALRRVGILLFFAGRPQEALAFLQLATHAAPREAEGWLFLGNVYFQLGERDKAIEAWETYLRLGGEARERVQELIAMARAQAEGPSTGQALYQAHCAFCHGAEGQGGTGPRLKGNPILGAPEAFREVVLRGRGAMPAIPIGPEEAEKIRLYLLGR